MKFKRLLPTLIGILLFFGGIIISLSVSATMLWGEIEARLFMQQADTRNLKLECPLMVAPWETAEVRAVITNSLPNSTVTPQVNAVIGNESKNRVVSETLELSPLESVPMQWTVDSADVVFERLILVNIHQRPYRDLPSHQGTCSILVFSLFGQNGRNTFFLLVSMGVLASLLGMGIFIFRQRPFTKFMQSIAQLNMVFFGLVLLGLITTLFRLWGFTLFFDAAALLVFTTGSVEVFFSRNK